MIKKNIENEQKKTKRRRKGEEKREEEKEERENDFQQSHFLSVENFYQIVIELINKNWSNDFVWSIND